MNLLVVVPPPVAVCKVTFTSDDWTLLQVDHSFHGILFFLF